MSSVVVRFSEVERYDINTDSDVITLMGTTPTGSFWSEIPSDSRVSKRRQLFKERVVELIKDKEDPGQIEFEDG